MNSCGGLLLFGPRSRDEPRPDTDHVRFLSVMIAIVLAGMLLVRCAGPTAAMLFADDECGLLRDTVSWKSLRFAWRAPQSVGQLNIGFDGYLGLKWQLPQTGSVAKSRRSC